MPYIQRDHAGAIVGRFANPQPGYAEEWLSDDAPELLPAPEAVAEQFEQAVQQHLDTAAKARGYDSIVTAVSYAEEPAVPKFQADGAAFRAWRSLVWDYCYAQLAAVQAGEREQPTVEAFIAELPALVLPA